jgi:hypothetical protein
MCRFRFWGQNKNIKIHLTLSAPSEISRTAVEQLALPVTIFAVGGKEQKEENELIDGGHL